jgi:excisionase family DNA binding protein
MRNLPALPVPTIVDQLKNRRTYVKATETMAILGVSRKTLCDWVNSGKLPAYRLGKNNVFDPSVLANWLQQRSTGL